MSTLPLPDFDFRQFLYHRLNVDDALQPGNELYEPLYNGDPADPVQLIYDDIPLAEVESLSYIFGVPRGGQDDELFRLKKPLETSGHFVAYANALDYLLPTETVEISDVLLVLAGSVVSWQATSATLNELVKNFNTIRKKYCCIIGYGRLWHQSL